MFHICIRCGAIVYFTLVKRHQEEHEHWDDLARLVHEVAEEVTTIEQALGTLDEPGPLTRKWMGI